MNGTSLAPLSAPEPQPLPAPVPAPEAVVDFLKSNPDFLAERPDLFRALTPPKRIHGERLADHMAAMLAAERRRVRSLEAEVDAAVTAGRAGHGLSIRVRLAVLALMRAQDVVETLTEELPALLGVETCTLLAETPDRRGVPKLPRGKVGELLGPGRDALVRAAPTDIELLHQEAASLVMRDALVRVPVWTGHPTLMALGARDPQALPTRQATATLAFLGRAVAAALAR
ncbi:DUF484 family protein [Belnapia rosea]|uniref:DUF484 domain-containing protein n=1 Tax=Belnapia rosea TaxID=938405 RepID=A0A1G6VT62_9PROT|nr:DUF484 family protein [Belnapia rosea]SDB36133.1 hypothetical protein SAMN02927895_01329 [Belnapia rosea]SDD56016.1 hypothetical protein SAMN04487779_1009145 [Belnapia rosea]